MTRSVWSGWCAPTTRPTVPSSSERVHSMVGYWDRRRPPGVWRGRCSARRANWLGRAPRSRGRPERSGRPLGPRRARWRGSPRLPDTWPMLSFRTGSAHSSIARPRPRSACGSPFSLPPSCSSCSAVLPSSSPLACWPRCAARRSPSCAPGERAGPSWVSWPRLTRRCSSWSAPWVRLWRPRCWRTGLGRRPRSMCRAGAGLKWRPRARSGGHLP